MKLEAKSRLAAVKTCGCVATVCAHVTALTEKQKQLDIDGDGKIDGEDLKKVRQGITAATPKEAAAFVVQTFAKHGLKIKLAYDDGDWLSFKFLNGLGAREIFGLQLAGKKVIFDSQGSEIFNPLAIFSSLGELRANELDFAKLTSQDFAKWKDKILKSVGSTVDVLQAYATFASNFAAAMADLSAATKTLK